MGTTGDAWRVALEPSEAALTAALKVAVKKFNEFMHPRGADGRFISKGGHVKWLDPNSGLWHRGEIVNYKNGGATNGKSLVTVKRSDGVTLTLSNDYLYQVPAPKASLKTAKLKKVGAQAGSNPGGFYQDTGGQKYYVKQQKSTKHAINETLGARFLEALGVAVPEITISEDKTETAAKIEESVPWRSLASGEVKEQVKHQIRKNFVIDAWMANWDVGHADNVRVTADGTPIRVDLGGALDYRAQGKSKISSLTPEVNELQTMRSAVVNQESHEMFYGLTKEEEHDGVKRLLGLHPDSIRDIVKQEGGPGRLADDLIARRAWLATHYGYSLPETTTAGKKLVDEAKLKEDAVPPDMTPAVKKLGPTETPSIGVGSPVWLVNKKAHHSEKQKQLPNVFYVESMADDGTMTLKGHKSSAKLHGVPASDVEALTASHASPGTTYVNGGTSELNDKVTLPSGDIGTVVEVYPKYSKVELGDGKKKVVATSKLTKSDLPSDYVDPWTQPPSIVEEDPWSAGPLKAEPDFEVFETAPSGAMLLKKHNWEKDPEPHVSYYKFDEGGPVVAVGAVQFYAEEAPFVVVVDKTVSDGDDTFYIPQADVVDVGDDD